MPLDQLQRNTLLGFFASVMLAIVKLTAGLAGKSSALVADAVESFADTIGSVLVWQALRVSSRPPDERHPYGYGKAEALASLGVGVMLIGAAVYIVVQSVHEILIPHDPPAWWTLVVLLAVVAVKELLFRFVVKGAAEFHSDAASADAWHHRSDAITSGAALIGVSIAIWGPAWMGIANLVIADEAAAILASGIIVMTALNLIRPAFRELLDATSPETAAQVTSVAAAVEGVRLVEKVLVRKSGAGYHLDMHLQLDPNLSLRSAHALAGKVKAILQNELPRLTSVLIHIEPFEGASGTS